MKKANKRVIPHVPPTKTQAKASCRRKAGTIVSVAPLPGFTKKECDFSQVLNNLRR